MSRSGGKDKQKRVKAVTKKYLTKALAFRNKLQQFKDTFARKSVRTNEFSNVSEALKLQRYDPIQRDELAELK